MRTKKVLSGLSILLLLSSLLFAQSIVVEPISGLPEDFIRGVDISTLSLMEECGAKYFDSDGTQKDLYEILKSSGVNWIRLRLWNDPTDEKGNSLGGGDNNLKRTLDMAVRAKKAGFKLLLDFHYSDFWADPAKQSKPKAWKNLSGKELENAVYQFTLDSMKVLIAAGAEPDMVQTGNELNGGMLWPDGKTWADKGEEIGGFKGFGNLLKAAGKAVRETSKAKIAIHVADGGDNGLYRFVFDGITKQKVDYDCIGLSFYPYWHGGLAALEANMADLAKRYGKEMYVAETAYAYTEDDMDNQGNVFMVYSDENFGYNATVQGQATVVRDVMNSVLKTGGKLGIGIFYWEPAWYAVEGCGWKSGEGNNWDNQAMFDKTGKKLESLDVFRLVYGGADKKIEPKDYETVDLTIQPGEKEKDLPEKVKIIYSDDSLRSQKIIWNAHDFSKEKEIRTFTVEGKLEGTDFPVVAQVTVSDKVNLIADPSFESGKFGKWSYSGPGEACFPENNKSNSYTGSWTYKYWLGSAFKSNMYQTFENIPNGIYTLSVWAMGGGGEKDIKLYARDFGSGKTVSAKVTNTAWKEWHQFVIPEIEVTNEKCTVGIYLNTNPDCWGNFDDMEFFLNKQPVTLTAQDYVSVNDESIPNVKEDLSDSIEVASVPGKGPNVLQGLWIEANSYNTSLIRDVASGEKSGYEFDKSVFETYANWWFWGDLSKKFHLDAEISVWNIKHTMFQANSFGANVPDTTFADGLQGLAAWLFSPLWGANGNAKPGVFNKLGFNIKTPYVNTLIGYGNLKANGMSEWSGIFTMLDRWNDVSKGFVEFKNGNKIKNFGDNFTLNSLVGFSKMRGEYGIYSVISATLFDNFNLTGSFGSTTMSTEVFRYNEQNENAASVYASYKFPKDIKLEAHAMANFGTDNEFDLDRTAWAARLSGSIGKNEFNVTEKYSGENAATVWGLDSTLAQDSLTTELEYWYKNDDRFAIGLDGIFAMNDVDSFEIGKTNIRLQPMYDMNLEKLIKKDISFSLYSSVDLDFINDVTASAKIPAFLFEEAGIELTLADVAPKLKKLVFDYAAYPVYKDWTKTDGYKLDVFYHSLMCVAQLTDSLSVNAAGIYRGYADKVKTNQSIGLAAGVSIKTDIAWLGKPQIWMHMTYGMDPYEDVNYNVYRYDDPQNKIAHRSYRLNSVDKAMTESRIAIGLIWDIQ